MGGRKPKPALAKDALVYGRFEEIEELVNYFRICLMIFHESSLCLCNLNQFLSSSPFVISFIALRALHMS
jgi:hypothetical protein